MELENSKFEIWIMNLKYEIWFMLYNSETHEWIMKYELWNIKY